MAFFMEENIKWKLTGRKAKKRNTILTIIPKIILKLFLIISLCQELGTAEWFSKVENFPREPLASRQKDRKFEMPNLMVIKILKKKIPYWLVY